jgi:hypothetical protein
MWYRSCLGAVGKAVLEKYRTLSLGVVMAAGSLGQFLIVPLSGALIEQVIGKDQ